jgi:hypothetical protein
VTSASTRHRPTGRAALAAVLGAALLAGGAGLATQVDPSDQGAAVALAPRDEAPAPTQQPSPAEPVSVPVDAGSGVAGPVRDVVTPPPPPAPEPAPVAERVSRSGDRGASSGGSGGSDAGSDGGSDAGSGGDEAPAPPVPAGGSPEVVALVNSERAAAGCGPVTSNGALDAAAQGHSADMAANDYFSHTSLDGRSFGDRIRAAGYSGGSIAENIAAGQGSASSVMASWMESPGHRANILDCSFRHIGVGVARGGSYGTYWTQTFGG